MITCVVEYVIVPAKIDAFERFARRWIELVGSHGGMNHGYFLPAEGASDKVLSLPRRFGIDRDSPRVRDEDLHAA
jgi:hypothetical protein